MSDDLRVEVAGPDRIADLAPLWAALQMHHATLPDLPEARTVEESWRRRRGLYERWMAEGGRLFLAVRGDRPVGYLMLTTDDQGSSTWELGEGHASVETLAVLESERSTGVGSALMDAALESVDSDGIPATAVGVAATNVDARRFYERHGFRPLEMVLVRTRP